MITDDDKATARAEILAELLIVRQAIGDAWLAIGDDTPHAAECFELVNPIECDNAYDSWKAAQRLSKRSELRQDRLREMFAATCRYGSGNCWTGDTGELARMIRELLIERERILNQ